MEGVPSVKRVRQEVRRELWRASSFWGVTGALALCVAVAIFARAETALPVFTAGVYLAMPMLMAPFAALRIARDRESHLSAAHATTPLKAAEALLGKIIAFGVLLGLALAATLPLLYAMTAHAPADAFPQLIPLAGWGLIIGTASSLVGLIVGYAKVDDSVGALSAAFTVVFAWFLLPLQRARLYGWADTPTELRVTDALLHASPFTWGLDALAPDAAYLTSGHASALLGLTILLVPAALLLGAVSLGWQRMSGWRPRPLAHPLATGVVAVGLIATGGLLWTWDYPGLDQEAEQVEPEAQGPIGETQVGLRFETPSVWSSNTGTLELTLHGEANKTVMLQALEFTADTAVVEHDGDLPRPVQLTEMPAGTEGRGPGGWAELQIPITLVLQRLDKHPMLETRVTLDGDSGTFSTTHRTTDPEIPKGPPAMTSAALLIVAAGASIYVPRRLNRW